MPRLGVIGTMVWDRIYARAGLGQPVEEWGGITYALAALEASPPAEWEVVPLLKVGQDLEVEARRFLRGLPEIGRTAKVRTVPEPNNRVELRYEDLERRCERLSGGVPPWTWPELEPLVSELDALYVNFISGFEMGLETATQMRLAFPGPIYADLHSLLLGVLPGGIRTPQPLVAWRDWLRCFDIVQVNEAELSCLADAWGDPWRFAAEVVGDELKLLLVTLGDRGAAYVASPAYTEDPMWWRGRRGLGLERPIAVLGPVKSERIPPDQTYPVLDPTGCGDVWGATCFARLLQGEDLVSAMRAANHAAGRNAGHLGATGLYHHLQGRLDA